MRNNLPYVTPIVVGFKRGNVTATLVARKKERNVTATVVARKKGRNGTARHASLHTDQAKPKVARHEHNHMIYKEARAKRGKSFDSVYNYRVIMVISTRAVSAVILVIIFIKDINTLKVSRSSNSTQSLSSRCKESKRIKKTYKRTKASKLKSQKCRGNYTPNYLYVVISTRADSAVNEIRKHRTFYCDLKVTRLFTLGRNKATEAGEHIRTPKNFIDRKKRNYKGTLLKGNYYPNYGNVEISTRDVSTVKTKLCNYAYSTNRQEPFTLSRCCTKGGGAYDDRRLGQRDDKNITKIPFGETKNRVYLAICAKIIKNFHPLYVKTNGTLRKIWLYRTKARVEVTHRNEIYAHIYTLNLCTISSNIPSQVWRDMVENSNSTGVTHSNYIQINRTMSRLISPLRHKLDYKNESMAPFNNSISHKFLSRQQITKTKIILHLNMSEAEVQSAVDHIPGHGESSAVMNDIQALTTSSSDKQVRLIYDPVNDTFVQANEAVGTKNVGERRSDNVTDTGKKKLFQNPKNNKKKKRKSINQKTLCIAGTEFLVNQPNDNNAPDPINPDEHTAGTNSQKAVTGESSPSPSASTSPSSTRKTLPETPGLSTQTSSDDSNATGEFSSASDCEQQPNPNPKPQHEQIDPRIKLQKEKFWKKIGQNTDPRIAALVPIHAPKMERLSRLQALKQRASMKPNVKTREGDIVTGIMQKIDKTAEINYSVVPVGAEFVMEDELGATKNREIVTATNNPLTVRPKPPKIIQKRQDKVLPFPQRRGSTYKNSKRQEFDEGLWNCASAKD